LELLLGEPLQSQLAEQCPAPQKSKGKIKPARSFERAGFI
jgi:hypothetical protein